MLLYAPCTQKGFNFSFVRKNVDYVIVAVFYVSNLYHTMPDTDEEEPKGGPFFCYIISCGHHTYNGYTNNLVRRLRQHNGCIKGGARATTRVQGQWQYIAIVTSPEWSAQVAMKHEWTIKYPTRKRPRPKIYQGARGRIQSLNIVAPQIPEPTTMYIVQEHIHLIDKAGLPANIFLEELKPSCDLNN